MTARRLWIGLLFVLTGALLFLNTLGIVHWGIWWRLTDFWPILLISIGLTLAFERSRLAFLGPLALVVLALLLVFAPPGLAPKGHEDWSVALEPGVEQGRLTVDLPAGAFDIQPGPDLVKMDLTYAGYEPVMKYAQRDSLGDVHVHSRRARPSLRILEVGLDRKLDSSILLSPTIPWELRLDFGAADLRADLTEIPLNALYLDVGAGAVNLALGDSGRRSRISIESGVADVDISVPQRVGLKVSVSGALTVDNLTEIGLRKDGAFWYSENWDTATSSYEIHVKNAIGDIAINRRRPEESI